MSATIHHGDCLDVLREMPSNSVDAVTTDPPYGLSNTSPQHVIETMREWANGNTEYVPAVSGGFMGAAWDSFVPPPAVWTECFRVLMGQTQHTGRMIAEMLLEAAPFAPDTADMTDD